MTTTYYIRCISTAAHHQETWITTSKHLTRLLAAQLADQYTGDRLNSKCLVGQAQRLS